MAYPAAGSGGDSPGHTPSPGPKPRAFAMLEEQVRWRLRLLQLASEISALISGSSKHQQRDSKVAEEDWKRCLRLLAQCTRQVKEDATEETKALSKAVRVVAGTDFKQQIQPHVWETFVSAAQPGQCPSAFDEFFSTSSTHLTPAKPFLHPEVLKRMQVQGPFSRNLPIPLFHCLLLSGHVGSKIVGELKSGDFIHVPFSEEEQRVIVANLRKSNSKDVLVSCRLTDAFLRHHHMHRNQ